ncbi:MAG: glycosyltransferase family 2 protein [Chlamydiae bacterium]|nr:glycosyltransferase family 2 protein [Chlamydiota bacterium]
MYRGMRIAAVVPAHNEERLIERVVGGMPPFVDRIVVVDDGSTDATAARAAARADKRLLLVRHAKRRGVGAAIRTGYRKAIECGAAVAVVMPGDAQADPADLPRLLDPVAVGGADYSKGNRLADPILARPMPPVRRFGNRLLSALTRLAVGHPGIRDSQCGYTAAGPAALRALADLPYRDGYGYPNEMLCGLVLRGLTIVEVPVKAVYADETSGIWIPSYAVKMAFILARCAVRRMLSGFLRGAARPPGKEGPEPNSHI